MAQMAPLMRHPADFMTRFSAGVGVCVGMCVFTCVCMCVCVSVAAHTSPRRPHAVLLYSFVRVLSVYV